MPTVKVRNLKNEEVGDLELSDAVFGAELNEALIHAAVKAHLATARSYLFVDFLTTTTQPFAPGTAPRIMRRLFSTSTRATVRPFTVTRLSPMWPDERVPLMTREG